MLTDWLAQLQQLEQENLLRTPQTIEARSGLWVEIGGWRLLNFSSNDYLALSDHPRLTAAARQAAEQWGTGAGASRLVTGTLALHEELEQGLARLKGTESALVFSSGYLAALGLIQTLTRRADGSQIPIFFDRLSHACLIDAARHSGSAWRSFPHNNVEVLEKLLDSAGEGAFPAALVITEGVFSMDGDMAPLPELLAVCERHGALLVVDDAHGTGTIGPGGRGSVAHFGLEGGHPNLVQMGTLSKALGAQGGFVAGPAVLRRLLISRARAFIFDTALAPPSAAAALEAVRLLSEEPERGERLRANARMLRKALAAQPVATAVTCDGQDNDRGAGGAETPIVPLVIGEAEKALAAAAHLRDQGYLAVAIRPPTVPPGTSRLRLTVSAGHSAEQISALVRTIGDIQGETFA